MIKILAKFIFMKDWQIITKNTNNYLSNVKLHSIQNRKHWLA